MTSISWGGIIKYLKKDMNKVLLFLVLLPLLLFAFFSMYYNSQLRNITMEYGQTSKELEQTTGNVVIQQLNETMKLKESVLKDKEMLEESYSELRFENEALKKENEKLKSELAQKNSRLTLLEKRYDEVQQSLSTANEGIEALSLKKNQLCSKLKGYDPGETC